MTALATGSLVLGIPPLRSGPHARWAGRPVGLPRTGQPRGETMTKDRHCRRLCSALVLSTIATAACGSPDDTTDLDPSSTDQPLLVVPGADLRITSFTQTVQTLVDDFQRFSVTVTNLGSAVSNPTTLTVSLLQTQTSPQTFLL